MPLFPVATTLPPNISFDGQIVLITGGSSGLGFETAIHYVQLGASTVIITARDKARGARAVADIEARTGRKGVVQVRALDMNTFGNIKRLVDELKKDFKTIDVVLLNAGIINYKYEKSPDGWEIDMQVNVLSTALLALLLLPWMQAVKRPGKPQHLGIVASGMFKYANIRSKDFPKHDVLKYFNDEQHYIPGQPSYALTKLFVQYVAAEIAKLATAPDGSPSPILNTVCPGPVSTNIGHHFASRSIVHKALLSLYKLGTLAPDVGTRALVLVATTSPAEHGKFVRHYMTNAEFERYAAQNITNEPGKKLQAEVWKEIVDVLGAAVPEVKEILQQRSRLNSILMK